MIVPFPYLKDYSDNDNNGDNEYHGIPVMKSMQMKMAIRMMRSMIMAMAWIHLVAQTHPPTCCDRQDLYQS